MSEEPLFCDANGRQCAEPVECWECDGRGTSWSETCGTCGGFGKLCHPRDEGTSDAQ